MSLSRELINFNNNLSSKGIKLRVEQRGKKLTLRGPLPCRENPFTSKVQRISLNLPASREGLEESKKILELILLQLKHQQFDWKHWSKKGGQKTQYRERNDILKAVKSFEKAFFSDPLRKKSLPGSKTTWSSAYLPYLRRLIKLNNGSTRNIDSKILLETVNTYIENSRSKQQCATVLNAFANHLSIKLPEKWKEQSNGYGIKQARFRELPSDSLIEEAWEIIPNPHWKLAYGLMATYGLRNHEIFFCDLSCFSKNGDQILRVLPNTKTGEHQVWPFHPKWVEYFELDQLGFNKDALPLINTDLSKTTLQQVGRRVSEQFRRYKLPLTPYDLRHAWAIRTIHIGLPDTVSARMMGHSVSIHTKTYHHWITRRDQQKAVDAALAKK